jgi:hypothetical protein
MKTGFGNAFAFPFLDPLRDYENVAEVATYATSETQQFCDTLVTLVTRNRPLPLILKGSCRRCAGPKAANRQTMSRMGARLRVRCLQQVSPAAYVAADSGSA